MQNWAKRTLACILLVFLIFPAASSGYSVLAHETIVDAVWLTDLSPRLRKRFPGLTEDQLRQAHAYAYGGAIIQDLGYYPYGSKFFSDLTHYVRSGDFIQAMLRDAQDFQEYAFALGALAHYAADNEGHSLATNRAVPLLYPRLKSKFGDVITYEDDPAAHLKTEFGFDVLEIAHGRFAPDDYHNFIGFEVARPLLDRAFRETYGLDLPKVLENEDRALGSYRHAVSKTIPKATRVAWALKKDQIKQDQPTMTRKRFLYNLSRASYEKHWGKNYRAPTASEKFLAFLFRLIPKVGKLRALAFHTPTPETEQLFERSFNATLTQYRRLLKEYDEGKLVLPNDNFDVGAFTPPGKYWKNDNTHAVLLDRLAQEKFAGMPEGVRAELLRFYSDPNAPYATRRNPQAWQKLQDELQQLRSVPAMAEAAPNR